MEKMMWFIQSVTAGHTQHRGTISKARRAELGQPSTAIAQDSRDNPAEQPWLEKDRDLSPSLLAQWEWTLLE